MIFNLSERDTVCYEIISKFGINIKDLIDIIEQLVNKGVGVSVVTRRNKCRIECIWATFAIFGGGVKMEWETI